MGVYIFKLLVYFSSFRELHITQINFSMFLLFKSTNVRYARDGGERSDSDGSG
jgi:hypothetical protein